MTRLEKCKLAKEKGFRYNPETGDIYGIRNAIVETTNKGGYIKMCFNVGDYKKTELLGHHFAWYMTYGNVDFDMLDHINGDRIDNRISNLRIADSTINNRNIILDNVKGFNVDKRNGRFISRIVINKKLKYIGSYITEQEAREAYLNAKEKYHSICPQ
jgi:hypothetical protein